jgi:hypothetical protein
MRLVLVLLALGACSFPEKELVDAGTPFGCFNAPNPTTADNPSVMSGIVIDGPTRMGIPDASIAGRLSGSTVDIFVARSGADGTFRQSQNTNGSPVDISLAVTANGYFDTYYYPPTKLTQDVDFGDVAMISPMVQNAIAQMAQITIDPMKGQILLRTTDCLGKNLAGATVATNPPGTVVYFAGLQPNPAATSTDTDGNVLIANVPEGTVMLSGMVNGMALRAHSMQVKKGSYVATALQP